MGAASAALVGAALLASAGNARADSCVGTSSEGHPFPACFDPGNRLTVSAATDGFGVDLALRHTITFEDEPDLAWKLEHDLLDVQYDSFTDRFAGILYRGRFIRHSRDGHVVIPFGDPPRKLPGRFDIGALFEVGDLRWHGNGDATLEVVKTAALVDLAHTRDFKRRLAFGPVASWNVEMMRSPIAVVDHRVAPFSSVLAELHLESDNGLTLFDAHGEVGTAWHTGGGWRTQWLAEASLERVVIAINDRPVALFASARYDSSVSDAIAAVGVRFVLVDRADPRVPKL